LTEGEVFDPSRTRLRWLDARHIPGPREANVLFGAAAT